MIRSPDSVTGPIPDSLAASRKLFRAVAVTAMLWAAGMAGCWIIGIEPIYAHPAPFYAMWYPAGIARLFIAVLAWLWWMFGARLVCGRFPSIPGRPDTEPAWRGVAAMAVLLISFTLLTASVRGVSGIWQAYSRETYEVVGDIGKASSIPMFFRRYLEIQPWLSMHGKVHPPGPASLLWLFSYVAGRSAPGLAVATVFFGALSVPFMWLWCRRAAGKITARAAALLFACMPSVVLFGAVSADFLFLPVTVGTLWLFHEAMRRRGHMLWSAAAGAGYAAMALLKYSLPAVGIWFGIVGLLALRRPGGLRVVCRAAAVMGTVSLGLLLAVYWATGFNYLEGLARAAEQFRTDQRHLDLLTPRYPGWTFQVLFNPLTFFYFAGFPVSLLALAYWFRRISARARRMRLTGSRVSRWVFTLTPGEIALASLVTALVLNALYLARGEGERSALYLFPFLALPAARMMAVICRRVRSDAPLITATLLMAAQTVVTEYLFYTYW